MSNDNGLNYLLDLNGEVIAQDYGCWIKVETSKLHEPTIECPHGIKYCLTLHDQMGKRLLGFDNAHPVKLRSQGRFSGRRIIYDHIHTVSNNQVEPYIFESAEQLITDFFREVDKVLTKYEK